MLTKQLTAALLALPLLPMGCWTKSQEFTVESDACSIDVQGFQFHTGTASWRSGSFDVTARHNGDKVTEVTLVGEVDGERVPPPATIYAGAGTGNLEMSHSSGSLDPNPADAILEAIDDGAEEVDLGMELTFVRPDGSTYVEYYAMGIDL